MYYVFFHKEKNQIKRWEKAKNNKINLLFMHLPRITNRGKPKKKNESYNTAFAFISPVSQASPVLQLDLRDPA